MPPLLRGGNMDPWELSAPDRALLELQEKWRTRLKGARERYDQCSQRLREVVVEVNSGLLPAPDGASALQIARVQENIAVEEYMQVLRIFNDLVVHGKMPEGEW